jgi:subtilisin family serine protease
LKKPLVFRSLISFTVILLVFLVSLPQIFNHVEAKNLTQEEGPVVDPELTEEFDRSGSAGYLIYFDAEADLSTAYSLSWEARGDYVYKTLTALAEGTQKDVRSYLDDLDVAYQTFWIDNIIAVESSDWTTFEGLMSFTEIQSLTVIGEVQLVDPASFETDTERTEINTVESNLVHINADDVWAMGYTGANIVVGNIDTGVNYTHEALVGQYRGNIGGGMFNHNYNWLDAVSLLTTPYDDHFHGSHTMGIMVGDNGGIDHIGVAPEAEWVACKAFNASGDALNTQLLRCAQFMLAPTLVDGTGADPDMRPHVVNNSWGDCGRSYASWFQGAVSAWLAAGIYPVFSAGNATNCKYAQPPGLNTVGNPARYGNVTAVGSTGTKDGEYAIHSNWGPTDNLDMVNPVSGYEDIKPQVVAPGYKIRSALGNNFGIDGYGLGIGTSMAAPHAAGLIALMWESATCLVGDYAVTETLLQESAVPILYDDGYGLRSPNYATGWGEIDAEAAVLAGIAYCGDGFLDGHIYDLLTSDKVASAAIEADAQGDPNNDCWGMTDADGYYIIAANSGETYNLTVTTDAYEPATITDIALASPGTTISTDFILESYKYFLMPFFCK